jgi:hypothetical protein
MRSRQLSSIVRRSALFCFFALLFSLAAVASPQMASDGDSKKEQLAPHTKTCHPSCEELRVKVRKQGFINVIVHLDVPDLPSDRVPKDRRHKILEIQEKLITQAQDQLLQRMARYGVSHVTRFQRPPAGVSMAVKSAALEDLIANPIVTDIYENEFLQPMLRDSVPLIGADAGWSKN